MSGAQVRLVIEKRPADEMPSLHLAYDYRTGDLDTDVTAIEIRTLREEADQLSATARIGAAAAPCSPAALSIQCEA